LQSSITLVLYDTRRFLASAAMPVSYTNPGQCILATGLRGAGEMLLSIGSCRGASDQPRHSRQQISFPESGSRRSSACNKRHRADVMTSLVDPAAMPLFRSTADWYSV